MRFTLTSGGILTLGIAALAGVTGALAEPVPLPAVDFQAKAKMMNKGEMTIHHAGNMTRVEMQMPGLPEVVGIMDLGKRKMLMMGAVPGMSNMAIEIGLGKGAHYGQAIGNGRRVGTAMVAGESCELWQMDEAKDHKHGGQVTVCLASDHIPLRTEVMNDGKPQVVMEVTEVSRVPQKPSLFEVPDDVQVMKLPKGMGAAMQAIPGLSGQ